MSHVSKYKTKGSISFYEAGYTTFHIEQREQFDLVIIGGEILTTIDTNKRADFIKDFDSLMSKHTI